MTENEFYKKTEIAKKRLKERLECISFNISNTFDSFNMRPTEVAVRTSKGL